MRMRQDALDDLDREQHMNRWVAGLLLLGAAMRVCFFFFATNNGGDALARAAITAHWLRRPTLALELGGPNWPPVHFWMMGAFSFVLRNPIVGSRLLSLVFGVFSLYAFWRLARNELGMHAAVLSLILFVFYCLHIGYSTTSSSEATYLGLLLASLLCFFAHRRRGSLWILSLGGVLLTIDAGIRYEAWVFIFLMGVVLLFSQGSDSFWSWNHLRKLLVFAATAGAWPVFWMVHEWNAHGQPFFALNNNYGLVADQLAQAPSHQGIYQLLLPPGVVLLTLTPLAVVGGAYALVLAVRETAVRALALIAVAFALIQFRTFASGGSLAMARYTLTDGTLLALFGGYGLFQLLRKFPICSYRRLLQVTIAIAVANLFAITYLSFKDSRYVDKFRSISPLLQYPRRIEQVRQFLGPHLKPSDPVVIDNYNTESNALAAAIGQPLASESPSFLASETSPARVWNFIEKDRPQYVIWADSGVLRPYMPLPSNCSSGVRVRTLEFSCVFQGEIYKVYTISYPLPSAAMSNYRASAASAATAP